MIGRESSAVGYYGRFRIYLFIKYNTITDYTASGRNRTHNSRFNSIAHHPLDYQGTPDLVKINQSLTGQYCLILNNLADPAVY